MQSAICLLSFSLQGGGTCQQKTVNNLAEDGMMSCTRSLTIYKCAGGVVLSNIEEEDEGGSIQVGTMPSPPRREAREKELLLAYGQLGAANEVLNERAVAVMKRMSDKLTGRDFLQEVSSSISSQDHLLMQACWTGAGFALGNLHWLCTDWLCLHRGQRGLAQKQTACSSKFIGY